MNRKSLPPPPAVRPSLSDKAPPEPRSAPSRRIPADSALRLSPHSLKHPQHHILLRPHPGEFPPIPHSVSPRTHPSIPTTTPNTSSTEISSMHRKCPFGQERRPMNVHGRHDKPATSITEARLLYG
jgi:hypothetical protein